MTSPFFRGYSELVGETCVKITVCALISENTPQKSYKQLTELSILMVFENIQKLKSKSLFWGQKSAAIFQCYSDCKLKNNLFNFNKFLVFSWSNQIWKLLSYVFETFCGLLGVTSLIKVRHGQKQNFLRYLKIYSTKCYMSGKT